MNFIDYLKEGAHATKQNVMLSKVKLEKHLKDGNHIQINGKDGDTLWLNSDKKWMINTKPAKFADLYQMYRDAYKNNTITD